jgi:hypothetical protein
MSSAFLAQTDGGGGSAIGTLFYLAVIVLCIAGCWRVFAKAGQPGWAVLIPIYNFYVLCRIAGRPGWWVILMLVPLVNIIVVALLSIDVARAFGKGVGFGIGLLLLSFVFYPILGFGSAQYQGASR